MDDAFFQAIKVDFSEFKDVWEFKHEVIRQNVVYQMIDMDYSKDKDVWEFKRPEVKMMTFARDLVIIKIPPKTAICSKDIARNFGRVNILGYESPYGYFSEASFKKMIACAWLYASQNDLYINDITVTLINKRHPYKLFKYLREDLGHTVSEQYLGVYQITGQSFAIQYVESKKLNNDDNLWLRSLSNGVDSNFSKKILQEILLRRKETDVEAYMKALFAANPQIIKEADEMMTPELREALIEVGFAGDWELMGLEKGREEET
jgi:hypothetical protein